MVLKCYPQNYEGFIELSKPHKSFEPIRRLGGEFIPQR